MIGNEALFTKGLHAFNTKSEKVLLGMDILRMALERSTTAKQALDVVIHFIENYEQG